ncbi:hypothetical protein YK48G_04540 [Lentilactobacillus fungorum]|uniref:Uncharacterized protein n=1 Tax=Lentilactobacillus fungorum TaxID=2201250 RepID=A0ABQ3W030_9LACO|nr:hypothetical protein YK48G_04540 [Lentilactobacillus fungorum]
MSYIDIFNIKHENAKIVNTRNDFNRIFIIEDTNGVRYACLKTDAPEATKTINHFKPLKPECAPLNYLTPYFTGKRHH